MKSDPEPSSGLPPIAFPPLLDTSITALPAVPVRETQTAMFVTLGINVLGCGIVTRDRSGSTQIVLGRRSTHPTSITTLSDADADPSVMVTVSVAVPLFAPVTNVIALKAAIAFARELVKVTLLIEDHALPTVRVSPVVVGRDTLTPATPLTLISVVMFDPLENPLAEYEPTVALLALFDAVRSAGPVKVGESATTAIDVRFSVEGFPARSVGGDADAVNALSNVQR